MTKATNTLMKCLPPRTRQQLVELSTRSNLPAVASVCELIDWAWAQMKLFDLKGATSEQPQRTGDNSKPSDASPERGQA